MWGCFINTPTWFDLIILNHTKNKNVTTPGRESRAETRVMHTQKSFGLFFCCGLPTDGGILTQMQQTECVRNLKYISDFLGHRIEVLTDSLACVSFLVKVRVGRTELHVGGTVEIQGGKTCCIRVS